MAPRPSICRPSAVNSLVLGICALCAAGGQTPAWAEKADREKPVQIEADKMLADDSKKESVFEGNVVVTQGTLQIKGDRVIVRQDSEGFQYGIAYGKPAAFRQKRDGVDEYIEGFAERLEYDGKKDFLQMFSSARLTKGTDEVRGDYISYNAKNEFFQVVGGGKPAATAGNPDGRVRAVIIPKPRPAPGTERNSSPASSGTTLKPSSALDR